ncbi:putative sporulation protein YyaC [Clostridium pascui]|uniref:spore protease YyaC n=1 Tax=Clostridium pascui TaxID=46609 RepID=UPI00195A1381|nr:spore protease YyaC [Clostridium pascui]MBM7872177.1 putative sporulation protein YyaC [Clostridium pascui]
MEKKIMFDSSVTSSIFSLRDTLTEFLSPVVKSNKTIVLLCIGSDRSTGDSLGPLVGHKLKFLTRDNFYIYGNLENPVHAKNLCETIEEIHIKFKNPYIIAIDACLGSIQNIGKVCVEEKPLSPGSAMNKNLPEIGDLSITGIVNISGSLEFMVLQNTRLYTVMQLAEIISEGIYHSVLKTIGGKKIEKSRKVILNN